MKGMVINMGLKSVSDDRVEEIRQSIGSILKELLTKGSDEMETYFSTHTKEVVDEVYTLMQELYRSVHEAQEKGQFGKLSYVRVFPRRMAVIEGTYHFIIRVYDEAGYTNPKEISTEWRADFLANMFERQLLQVQKKVETQVFRLTTREQQLVKLMYADAFTFLVMAFLTILRTAFIYVENMTEVSCAERILLTFGNYLEEGAVIEVFENPGGVEA